VGLLTLLFTDIVGSTQLKQELGKEIYRHGGALKYVTDQDVMTGLELKAGLNVLVFKVVNETEGWQGSIRFTDRVGHPVKGIQMTLTP